MTLLLRCALALLLLQGAISAQADPNADLLTDVFVKVCLPNTGSPEAITAWAAERHLPEITNAAGRKVFVGDGPSGTAWWLHGETTELVLSIRSTGACAVFAGNADPTALSGHFDEIVDRLSTHGTEVAALPDRSEPGPNGTRVGKLKIFSAPDKRKLLVLTFITDERPGGAFQGSLQILMGSKD